MRGLGRDTHEAECVANELSPDGPILRDVVAPPSEERERRYKPVQSAPLYPTPAKRKQKLTIRHEQAEVVRLLPVREGLLDGAALLLVVVVLEEVPHDPLALGLSTESEAEAKGVEDAPEEGVGEGEGDLGVGTHAEGREEEERGAVEADEGEGEVRVPEPGREVSKNPRRGEGGGRDAPEDVKVRKDEEVLAEVPVVEVVAGDDGSLLLDAFVLERAGDAAAPGLAEWGTTLVVLAQLFAFRLGSGAIGERRGREFVVVAEVDTTVGRRDDGGRDGGALERRASGEGFALAVGPFDVCESPVFRC